MSSEYIVITKTKSDIQKVLNQWKHTYDLDIIKTYFHSNDKDITIVLNRKPKENS